MRGKKSASSCARTWVTHVVAQSLPVTLLILAAELKFCKLLEF